MSITQAAAEIGRAPGPSRTPISMAIFKARQRAIEGLIDRTEVLVASAATEIPGALRLEVRRTMAAIEGRVPPWLDEVQEPEALLDHLFIAEGELRQRFYSHLQLELDESA